MKELLRHRGFRNLWLAQVALTLGDAMMQMGLLELFRLHGYDKRVETAKMAFAIALPGLLLGPLAMVYLDRWQRRSVLMISDAARALIVVGIAVWLLLLSPGAAGRPNLIGIYLLIGLIGVIAAFYLPARSALIPNLVGPDKLVPANTLFATSVAVAAVGGRALGGFVAERCGVQWAVLSNALAYLVSVTLVSRIRMTPHPTSARLGGIGVRPGWSRFANGVVYLWKHPTALPLVGLTGVFAFLLGMLLVEFVGYAMNTLRLGTGGVGYLIGAAGIGAAIGIMTIARSKRWTRADWLAPAQLLIGAAALAGLALTTRVWVAVPMLVLLGAVGATIMIPIDTKLQAQVPDQRRGAVFAARGIVTSAAMVFAFWLQFGTVALQRHPPPQTLLALAVVAVISASFAWLLLRIKRAPSPVTPGRAAPS